MHIAAEQDHFALFQWLYEKEPKLIDQLDNNKQTPLHIAAFHEQIPILTLFIEKLKANLPLIQQITQKNCPKTLTFLLEQGVDPDTSNSFQQTLLHLAAEAGQAKNVLCLLQYKRNR